MSSVYEIADLGLSKGIILWDIDGTLVRNRSPRRPSTHLKALNINNTEKSHGNYAGVSDWEILYIYGTENGLSTSEIDEAFLRLDSLETNNQAFDVEVYRGATALLSNTRQNGWINGILTGNTYSRAMAKLLKSNLVEYFDPEAFFCCEVGESRNKIALRSQNRLMNRFGKIIVVGDTEHDIRVAKNSGYKVIVVNGKIKNLTEFQSFKPDLLLQTLDINPTLFLEHLNSI